MSKDYNKDGKDHIVSAGMNSIFKRNGEPFCYFKRCELRTVDLNNDCTETVIDPEMTPIKLVDGTEPSKFETNGFCVGCNSIESVYRQYD